jgi:hypothetical protein
MNRREFVAASAAMLASPNLLAQLAGDRPKQAPGVQVLNPGGRVPVSLIIDDSTCLVNLAHFCIPQFAEVFPDRYKQPWKTLPREIPDAFVRKFGEWCHEHGVKGKYSVIPYPACVGWLDRELPGWSKKELQESIKLVQTLLAPDWDFHPEMVTHTWIINTKTGRPYDERSDRFMENWRWTDGKSADEIADYLTYALRILHNIGIPCEGVTTPGGFGNRALPALSQATLQSCRDVFKAEIPHYFRHLYTDERSVAPRVEYASGLDGADPQCVVSIIGCTGDWFGGWDGLEAGSVDQFITEDLKSGRMVEVIKRGEPAVMVCHWPGIYFNGQEVGFNIFKEIVRRLDSAYKGKLIWMKLSEIARYWAAKALTRIETVGSSVRLHAPFACPAFTLQVPDGKHKVTHNGTPLQLQEASGNAICFDLPKGLTEIS